MAPRPHPLAVVAPLCGPRGLKFLNLLRSLLGITLAASLTQALFAADFEVSGRQEIRVVVGSTTSSVAAATFSVTSLGTNWAVNISYTNTWARAVTQECVALVAGRSYTAEWYANGTCGGLVMDRPSDRLDAATEFVRVLVGAFLVSKDRPGSVTEAPVGFLHPRHPALRCYRPEVMWSSEPPLLPGGVRFVLDDGLCERIPPEAVGNYFRSGFRDRSLFRRWQETQKSGAEYSVHAWTNWGGLTMPQGASLAHTHFEHINGEQTYPRVHLLTLTAVQRPRATTVIPSLLPGSSVQEVMDGKNYLYTSADGTFLPSEKVKQVGTLLTKTAPPRMVTALNKAWSLPWSLLLLMAAAVLVGGIAWCWFTRLR